MSKGKHSEAKITLDFKKIKDRETSSPGDFDSSFNKVGGLFDIKNAALLRLAEMVGHEGAHALYAMLYPSKGVQIQRAVDDQNAAIHNYKGNLPFPPDVAQKISAADAALIPTERFAQQIEKIINGELRAGKVK